MPLIDVTDVLLDPEIAGETFRVIRRQETVNSLGRSVHTLIRYWATGSVTPTGDNSLIREVAFQTQNKTIKVITTFELRGEGKDRAGNHYQPDIVVWNHDAFLVKTINDWSRYGAGMIEADCMSQDFADIGPGDLWPDGE